MHQGLTKFLYKMPTSADLIARGYDFFEGWERIGIPLQDINKLPVESMKSLYIYNTKFFIHHNIARSVQPHHSPMQRTVHGKPVDIHTIEYFAELQKSCTQANVDLLTLKENTVFANQHILESFAVFDRWKGMVLPRAEYLNAEQLDVIVNNMVINLKTNVLPILSEIIQGCNISEPFAFSISLSFFILAGGPNNFEQLAPTIFHRPGTYKNVIESLEKKIVARDFTSKAVQDILKKSYSTVVSTSTLSWTLEGLNKGICSVFNIPEKPGANILTHILPNSSTFYISGDYDEYYVRKIFKNKK